MNNVLARFQSCLRRLVLPAILVVLAFLVAAGTLGAAPVYPLKVGPTGRYLVDQNGVPFLMAGESPQAMIGNLSEADAELFFANRKGHGFNTVWINLLCAHYTACNVDGSTRDGVAPFTALLNDSRSALSPPNYDLAARNEAYFARADRILQLAAQYGFLVILDPIETGSWLSVLEANGLARARDYGQYLGRRYASFDNILWMHGNDFQIWRFPEPTALVQEVARGIQDSDFRHLHTVELDYPVSSSLDDPTWAPLIQVNAAYTYAPTYQQVLLDYSRSPLPTFMVEASYELEQNFDFYPNGNFPQVIRRQEYWSLLSGATGQLFGNRYTWQLTDSSWKDQLNTPGAIQMAYVTALFESRAWYDLVPDQTHTVVTAGFGTFGEPGVFFDSDYVTAARTPDGTLAMAYIPPSATPGSSSRAVTIDLRRLSGPVIARWYDPAAGTFAAIPGSPLPNTGPLDLTTPGINAGGDQDWVLVLEVSAVTAISPDPVDLAAAPGSFTIAGGGFADAGAGFPVVNFVGNGVLLGQARATTLTGGTTLTVPFPTDQTSLSGPLPGLGAGPITVTVYNQTPGSGFNPVGSIGLTANDTRCTACVTGITPNPTDLGAAPLSLTLTGGGFANLGAGFPVVNFTRDGLLLGQARATALTGGATLTVPFPTNQTSLSGPLPGLLAGPVTVTVYNQTLGSGFNPVGSIGLTVNDTRCGACVTGITPNPTDLAAAPGSFTLSGGGFGDLGAGLPVVNFVRDGALVGQARATALTGGATLTVPFPTNQTSLSGPLQGLNAGAVTVTVYNQTPGSGFNPVGSISLTVNDTRCGACVTGITPNPADLAAAPGSFTLSGGGFGDLGAGLPVVNFVRNGVLVGQARATALTGDTTLTVPFPSDQTSLSGPLPGLTAGPVAVTVYNQTPGSGFNPVGSISLTLN